MTNKRIVNEEIYAKSIRQTFKGQKPMTDKKPTQELLDLIDFLLVLYRISHLIEPYQEKHTDWR